MELVVVNQNTSGSMVTVIVALKLQHRNNAPKIHALDFGGMLLHLNAYHVRLLKMLYNLTIQLIKQTI